MEKFLYQVAQSIYKNHKNNLENLCIIFPNKRAGIFFRKYLSQLIEKNIFSPQITTINEFIYELSSIMESKLQLADNLTLIFELYKVYKEKLKTSEDFDSFYQWGKILLNDFDEIDKEIIPTELIFNNNPQNLKKIEHSSDLPTDQQIELLKTFWSELNTEKKSKYKKIFLEIWSALPEIYYEFKTILRNKNLAYEGMIYRDVIEKIKQNSVIDNIPYEKIIFCGFNYLTKSEEYLFELLKENNKAYFFWDTDEYYINNKNHEAGFFLRNNILKFPQTDDFSTKMSNEHKSIKIYAVSSDTSQSKLTGQILEENPNFANENTAIILPDKHLLFPVLHSIPKNMDKINLTIGYPLNNSAIYGLIKHIIDLHRNKQKNESKETIFYYRDVIAILKHQLCYNKKIADNIIKEIEVHNKIYYLPKTSDFHESEIYKKIFKNVTEITQVFDYLLDILLTIYNSIGEYKTEEEKNQNIQIEKEFIFQTYLAINRLKDVIVKQNITLGIESSWKLITQILNSTSVPFVGEPVEGLQIMGVPETCSLDFDNVFILSMNEGIFPKNTQYNSFIPYNIRKGFNLPTYENNDAINSYNFYRLLQRAKNIYLFYNTEKYSGEMSRFLYQLKYESPFNIEEYVLANEISIKPPEIISIPKTPEILDKMKNLYIISENTPIRNQHSLSPSDINTYLDCGLKFYFQNIADLVESKEIIEEIDEETFGKLFHKTVEILYSTYKNKKIDKSDFYYKRNICEFFKRNLLKIHSDLYNLNKKYKRKSLPQKSNCINIKRKFYKANLLFQNFNYYMLIKLIPHKSKNSNTFNRVNSLQQSSNHLRLKESFLIKKSIHNYSNYLGLKNKKTINDAIEKAFKKIYNESDNKPFKYVGNQLIIKNILEKYIKKLLEIDEQYAPFKILALEEKLYSDLEVNIDEKIQKIKMVGIIDRIDKKDNIIRIIDYKTGRPKSISIIDNKTGKLKDIEKLFEKENHNRNKDIMQIIFYTNLFSENNTNLQNNYYKIIPHLFYIRNLFGDKAKIEVSIENINDEFKEKLKKYVAEIFDKNTEFTQTKNLEICKYCPYKNICGRKIKNYW